MKEFLTADMVRTSLANMGKLTFEVTDACNLQCRYCGYGKLYDNYDRRENKRLSLNAAKRLFDYLSELWSSEHNMCVDKTINIGFYGGEPLLNMPFVKGMVEHIENKSIPERNFEYSMTTNAMLLDRYMNFLADNKFRLLISLDGNEYNNSYRTDKNGNSVFDTVIRNISLLQCTYSDYFKEYVNFNAVLHNRNSVEDIYSFIKTNYGKTPSIGEINSVGVRKEAEEDFQEMRNSYNASYMQAGKPDDLQKDNDLDFPGYKEVIDYIFEYSGFVYNDYFELMFGKSPKKIPTGTCIPFGKDLFVTVNGKIFPCEHIGHKHPLGWINEDIMSIFQK